MSVRGIFTGLIIGSLVLGAGCGSGGGGGGGSSNANTTPLPGDVPPVTPGTGFPSDVVLFTTAQGTEGTLSALSVDVGTGALGTLPQSPAGLGVPIGPDAVVVVDETKRRVFVALDESSAVAVFAIDATGRASQVPGSPFTVERSNPTALALGPGNAHLYVGYESSSTISQYTVDEASGALGISGTPVTMSKPGAKAIAVSGAYLYATCFQGRTIATFRIGSGGQLTAQGEVATSSRPIDLQVRGGHLFASLCNCDGGEGAVDAFAVDSSTGVLTRIAGAPFRYPGIENYQRLAVSPDGLQLAASVHVPPSIAVFDVALDGTLWPAHSRRLHVGTNGPLGLAWTPDGRFLYLADNRVEGQDFGVYVFENTSGGLADVLPGRYSLPGQPVHVGIGRLTVNPQ